MLVKTLYLYLSIFFMLYCWNVDKMIINVIFKLWFGKQKKCMYYPSDQTAFELYQTQRPYLKQGKVSHVNHFYKVVINFLLFKSLFTAGFCRPSPWGQNYQMVFCEALWKYRLFLVPLFYISNDDWCFSLSTQKIKYWLMFQWSNLTHGVDYWSII